MAIEPTTVVRLYENIPWSRDKLDFRYFSTFDERNKYFNETKNPKWSFTNFSYLRHEDGHPIAIPIGSSGYDPQSGDTIPTTYSQVLHCNYVFYQNANYKERWFGGFVTDVKYINDGTVWVYFEEDIFQNWFPYITIDSGFIERETVASDNIGEHLINENINGGDYVTTIDSTLLQFNKETLIPVIFMSEPPLQNFGSGGESSKLTADYFNAVIPAIVNGWYNGIYALVLKDIASFWNNESYGAFQMSGLAAVYQYVYKDPSVICVQLMPNSLLSYTSANLNNYSVSDGRYDINKSTPVKGTVDNYKEIVRNFSEPIIDGQKTKAYRNNKCYTNPFVRLVLDCNGNKQYLSYEYFTGKKQCKIGCSFGVGADITVVPSNYCGQISNRTYQVFTDSLPTLTWTKDSYERWYANNSASIRFQIAQSVGRLALLAVAGAAVGGSMAAAYSTGGELAALEAMPSKQLVSSGINTYNQSVTSLKDIIIQGVNARSTPNEYGGATNLSAKWNSNTAGIYAYCESMNEKVMRSVDDYFSMLGYKVNRVGKPKLTSRKNWNYIKTQNAHCSGVVPQYAIEFMERALDTGCTFWHKNAVGDYGDLSNPIV